MFYYPIGIKESDVLTLLLNKAKKKAKPAVSVPSPASTRTEANPTIPHTSPSPIPARKWFFRDIVVSKS